LEEVALLPRRLVEAFDIQFPPPSHEGEYPRHVQAVAYQEQAEDVPVVIGEHEPEDDKVHEGEERIDGSPRHESLNAVMIPDPLHDIAHHLRVEEMQGQAHELGEEVRDQRYVNTGVYVQQYPAPDEVHGQLGYKDHQLRNEDEGYEAEVVVPYTRIHEALCEEGEG
jgi:hypothetical protein